MIFINTRPKSRAEPLTRALQDSGITVFDLPLLELSALPLNADAAGYQANLVQSTSAYNANAYNAIVVISPMAASMGLAACPAGFKPSCPVIAVGNATAKVLTQAGWQVLSPKESSNEGMIQMDVVANLQPADAVLIWRGQGGRRLLVNHLLHKGVRVDAIEWYVRLLPKETEATFKLMRAGISALTPRKPTKPIVLVSSGEAFNYWQRLVSQLANDNHSKSLNKSSQQVLVYDKRSGYNKLTDFTYLTFGKRLTDRLNQLQLTCERLDDLSVQSVEQGLKSLTSSNQS